MKSLPFLLIILVLLIVVSGIFIALNPFKTMINLNPFKKYQIKEIKESKDPIKVQLKMADAYAATGPVEVSVLITNTSDAPVLINRRLLINHEMSEGELFFNVERENGNKLRLQALITPRDLNDDDFIVLPPDESISKKVDLAERYGVKEIGTYKVTVTYHNEHHWSKAGLRAYVGSVSSDRVLLHVK